MKRERKIQWRNRKNEERKLLSPEEAKAKGYEIKGPMSSPLGTWIKRAGQKRLEHLARETGTSCAYLRNLGQVYRENPKIRFAIDIVVTIKSINDLARELDGVELPDVSLYDLAIPSRNTDFKGAGRWKRG